MPNNNLNHNVPGYSGNCDPGPSSRYLPITSDNENPELTTSSPEVPFVYRYGMVNARNGLEEVQMYRATLFNLNSEPEEDGENQKKEGDCVFLQQCTNDVMNTSEETITKIKAEPIYEAEENPWSEIKTEPSERYSDSMEISTNINLTNLEENDSENRRMVLQENAEGVDVAYDRNAPRPLYLKLKRKYTRAYGSEAGLNLIIFERCDKPEEMYGIPDTELPPNVGVVEISLDPFVDDIEESIVLGMEHSSYINRLIHFVRLEPEETPSSIDRLTVPIDNNYEGLQSLNEGVIDLINEDDNELHLLDELEPEETRSSIDTLTVPIDNNYEGLQSLNEGVIDLINEDDNELHLLDELEPEETRSSIDTLTVPIDNNYEGLQSLNEGVIDLINEDDNELHLLDELEPEETPSPIDTMTNPTDNSRDGLQWLNEGVIDLINEDDNELHLLDELEPEETPSSIDTLTVPIDNNYEGLQSLNEGVIDLTNEDDNELHLLDELEPEETPSPINTMTNPTDNSRDGLQWLNEGPIALLNRYNEEMYSSDESEPEETHSPIHTTTTPTDNSRDGLQWLNEKPIALLNGYNEEMYSSDESEPEETHSLIHTMTNPRASYMDNGNTNRIENLAVIANNIRKKREVVSKASSVSRSIKKPRLMYDV